MACNQNLLPFLKESKLHWLPLFVKSQVSSKNATKIMLHCKPMWYCKTTPYFLSDVVHCWILYKASDLSHSTRHFFLSPFFLVVEILVSEFLRWLFLSVCSIQLKQSGQYRWLVGNRYLWPSLLKKTPWITAWRIIPIMTCQVSHMVFFTCKHRNPTTRAF